MKDDQCQAASLLGKLEKLRFVWVCELGLHLRWEVEKNEPARLLLVDDFSRGFPEETARMGIEQVCERIRTGSSPESPFHRFREEVDLPNERFWEALQTRVLNSHEDRTSAIAARKAGKEEFLAKWSESFDDRKPIMSRPFHGFVNAICKSAPQLPLKTTDAMMDFRWVLFRTFCLYLLYSHINTIDDPPHFPHERLNQRVDLHYLALLNRGMTLVTADKEMHDLAKIVSRDAHLLSSPNGIPA